MEKGSEVRYTCCVGGNGTEASPATFAVPVQDFLLQANVLLIYLAWLLSMLAKRARTLRGCKADWQSHTIKKGSGNGRYRSACTGKDEFRCNC